MGGDRAYENLVQLTHRPGLKMSAWLCQSGSGQLKDLLRHGFHGAFDLRGECRTKRKLLAFDAVNQQRPRQTIQDARQFNRLAHAESMRGTAKDVFRPRLGLGIPYPNSTGRSARSSSVHENDVLTPKPAVHQRQAIAGVLYDFDPGDFDPKHIQAARDQQTSRIVPAIQVAAANDA